MRVGVVNKNRHINLQINSKVPCNWSQNRLTTFSHTLFVSRMFESESESVDFSAAVTEDYYAEAWVLV